jgi:chromosome segregation protein
MRLDSVEIVGFKSFCDRQELDFKAGVTGIVGPNGCGKSNISDAISWVLGEQSVKSLRGTAMEDVIFAGSQSRQPLAMAEVNLRITGLNGNSPDGSPECVVTRRLYRNGDSEYLMNGRICRLRDIHELFMDTGLGSKAYSIIEQGKIGLILSTKPADRRVLIEEAAGITKYKARRRQTSLKLEAAHQNLLRVNDIVHEVEKQLESLKRQASKARRYRAVREEMQAVERVLFGLRFLELREVLGSLDSRLAAESEREGAASLALGTEEARVEAQRTLLYEEEAHLEGVRTRLHEVELAADRHQARIGYCREQVEDAGARAEQAQAEAVELEGRVGPLGAELEGRREEESRLRGQLTDEEEEARSADVAVQDSAARQASVEREQETARDAQVALLGRIAALQNARESVTGSAERAGADLLKLAAETQELERDRSLVSSRHQTAAARGQETEASVASLAARREAALGRGEAARTRTERLAREGDALQSERDGLSGRLDSLQEMVATHAAFDEGVRALLAFRSSGADEGSPASPEDGSASVPVSVLGVVADVIETDKAHERAVEAFVGDRLQALLTPNASEAMKGIRFLEARNAGRGTFLPLASAGTDADTPEALRAVLRSEPKARAVLSDVYRVHGPHADRVRSSLPNAVVFDSLEDALDARSRHADLSCVTLWGETVRGAMIEGGRAVKGLLAPRREIREVTERLQQIVVRLTAVRAGEVEESRLFEAAAREARALEEAIHAAEKDLVAVRAELAAVAEEEGRISRKATVLESERRQSEEERGAAAVRLAEIEQALETAEGERARGSERLGELAEGVAGARADADAQRARASEARSRLAALRERAAAAEAECRRLAQDHEELRGRIEGARGRVSEMDRRRAELRHEIGECERLLAEALGARDRVTGEASAVEARVRDLRNEIDGLEQGLKDRRRERDMLREAVSEIEVARARAGADLDHLARECQQAVGQSAADAATALSDEERAGDKTALEGHVQELRDKLDRMGPVNVLAVEQAQELEERERFLTAQRQDLLDSIAEMDRAIKTIDRTSRERFREAFQVINQHFGEVFKQLFGGGTAGLSLIDEDDILESGIDVMAQPPGKRLQNVMLLSGGEKALTAIALLFAIFQYKPSPFCILDEVDAPLDDANIGRFVRMLEGLKEQTQFVLITHSRRTMEIADQLYGVTMEEPGVSKLVSVRFS